MLASPSNTALLPNFGTHWQHDPLVTKKDTLFLSLVNMFCLATKAMAGNLERLRRYACLIRIWTCTS